MLLVSTTSWTIGKHYCMGLLMDTALFKHAEDCGMDMSMDNEEEDATASEEDGCCNDEIIALSGQEDLKPSFNKLDLDQQLFLVAFARSYYNLFPALSKQPIPNEYYPPPLLVKDIQLLDEVFLI